MVGSLLADEFDLHPPGSELRSGGVRASVFWGGSRRSGGGWASTSTPTTPSSSRKTGTRNGTDRRTTAGSS
ncbi:hypothetical protein [Methanoculleus chikugoensis]|uniref:hypothetical protein n=1 Tax=Methanoculleus chikugoensis TaxID=118126 RepID=UPI001FB4932D|nr:hypothetical protein [Methanoculleus chikugoensis]